MATKEQEEAARKFADVARKFVEFADGAHRLPIEERILAARRHLSALLVAAYSLPSHGGLEVSSDVAEDTPQIRPKSWKAFGRIEHYWEVFDPYELDKPVAGSLSDDLLDVYSDLARGLALHSRGLCVEALWEWEFHFQCHWGEHAVDALRALHRASRQTVIDGGADFTN